MSLLCSLHNDDRADHLGGLRNIEVQRLAISGRCENRRVRECCIQLVDGFLGLVGPGKAFVLLQK
jgi:hypothetical protein